MISHISEPEGWRERERVRVRVRGWLAVLPARVGGERVGQTASRSRGLGRFPVSAPKRVRRSASDGLEVPAMPRKRNSDPRFRDHATRNTLTLASLEHEHELELELAHASPLAPKM